MRGRPETSSREAGYFRPRGRTLPATASKGEARNLTFRHGHATGPSRNLSGTSAEAQSLPSFFSRPVATLQSSFTALTDLSNIAFSSPFIEISTIFSTPFAPMMTGTPT
jgi:hypothetical protein